MTTTTAQAASTEHQVNMQTPEPLSNCIRCHGKSTQYSFDPPSPVPPGDNLCVSCRSSIKFSLRGIPPIYRRLKPITPARVTGNKPFVVILGECGVGKSVTAAELMETAAYEHGFNPTWVNVPDLLLKVRGTFSKDNNKTEEQIIREYCGEKLLCLDDLAAEKISDYTISTIYMILNHRGEYGRLTVITSNLTLDGISQRLDDRIASRLDRYGHVIMLTKNNVQQQQIKPIGGERYFEPELRNHRSSI